MPLAPALVVAGVVFWVLAMVSIRCMGQSGKRNITVVLLFTPGSIVSGLLRIPAWGEAPGGPGGVLRAAF